MDQHVTRGGNVVTQGWSDAAVDFIKEQSALGVSSSQIARQLREQFNMVKTRNAVIGKLMRCGAERPAVRAAATPRPVADKTPKVEKPKPLVRAVSFGRLPGATKKALPAPPAPPAESRSLSLSLRACGCAFPTGEADGEALFCGAPVAEDQRRRPYCAAHLRIMYPSAIQRKPPKPPFEPDARSSGRRVASDASFLRKWG